MILSPVIALSTSMLAAAPSPAWQANYAQALAESAATNKPVAVLIASGDPAKQVPAAAAAKLRANFVCVYADTATPAGRDLAATFRLSEGLVISDQGGKVQALRHGGPVAGDDLTRYADRFAAVAVTQTQYAGVETAPAVVPAAAVAPVVVAPAPVYAAPVFRLSGGCAGGRCGR